MRVRLLAEPDGLGRPPAVALRVLRQDLHLDAVAVGEDAAAPLVERDLDRPLLAALELDLLAAEHLALALELHHALARLRRDALQAQGDAVAVELRLALDRDPREGAERDLALAQDVAPVDDRPVDALVAGHGVLGLVDRVRPVVAGAEADHVDRVGALDPVVAVARVEDRGDATGDVLAARDPVVAGPGLQAEHLGRADVDAERAGPRRGEPVEQHAAGGLRRVDRELLVGIRAVDLGGVDAGAALVEVVVVAAVPDDRVVPVAAARVVARAGRVVVGDDPVVAAAALEQVGGVGAVERVVAVAAVDLGAEPERRDGALGGERVVAGVRVQVEHLGRHDVDGERAGTGRRRAGEGRVTRGRRRVQGERLGRRRAVHGDGVAAGAAVVDVVVVAAVPDHRVVAVAAADVELDAAGVQSGVGDERVVAAVGVELEPLGGPDVEVERPGTGRRETVEADAAGRGGRLDRERLGDACAVDLDRVGAVAAVHDVVVLAGAPDQQVVARLALEDVTGAGGVVVADDLVVAGTAVHLVDALAAEDLVVAGAGVHRRLG